MIPWWAWLPAAWFLGSVCGAAGWAVAANRFASSHETADNTCKPACPCHAGEGYITHRFHTIITQENAK